MRPLRLIAAAGFAALSITSCTKPTTGPGAPGLVLSAEVVALEKQMDDLRKPFSAAGAESDIDAVIAALPAAIKVTYGGKSHDGGTGATTITKVVVKLADYPEASVNIDELKLWGLNADLAKARVAGQQLEQAGPLARRIDAKGITLSGLGAVFNRLVADNLRASMPDVAAADLPNLGDYNFKIDRIVYDNVALRPFVLKPIVFAEGDTTAEGVHLLQTYAAWANAFSAEAYVYDNTSFDMAMKEDGANVNMKFAIPSMGGKNMNGGDIALAVQRGTTFDMKMDVSEGQQAMKMDFAGGVELSTYQDLRAAKALGYLAAGQMPPRTETDLMSLGKFAMFNERYTAGGKELYTAKEVNFDLSGWHWLIPTKIRYEGKEMAYNVENIIAWASDMQRQADPSAGDVVPKEVLETIKKHGMARPVMNANLGWDWNAGSGAGAIDGMLHVQGFNKVDVKFEGAFPSFAEVSAQIPENGQPSEAQMETLQQLFMGKTLLRSASFNLTDEGGLDKIFGASAEFITQSQGGQGEPVTAKSLRDQTVNEINTQASQVKADAPALAAVMGAVGEFLSAGKAINIALNPQPPLTPSEDPEVFNDPNAALKRLGLTVNGQKQ